MLRDVKHTITDFGIGVSTVKGEGVHIKIGVSPIVVNTPINITSVMDYKKIREKLGYSPLADACMDSIDQGSSLIYCIPVNPSIAGTAGEITKSGNGTGQLTIDGQPNNEYGIEVKILGAGEANTGTFCYSIDGGNSFSDELTIPVDGIYEMYGTGIKLNFMIGQEQKFEEGDIFKCFTTPPKMNNQGVLDALNKIKNSSLHFEYIHIVGESSNPLWAALAVESQKFFGTYYKPCFMICETRDKEEDETLDDYMQFLRDERKGIISETLQVVSARVEYVRADGSVQDINAAGIVAGLHARAKVQQSIGEVSQFAIPGVLELLPQGIEDLISDLDDLGYTTLRQYMGLEGFYINNSRTFAQEGSDYGYTERVRAMYKAVRETRKTALIEIQSQVDMDNQEGSLKAIVEFINVPVERMVEQKEFSRARVIIPEDQDILGTEKLSFKIKAVPIGILREIEIDMGFENPALQR